MMCMGRYLRQGGLIGLSFLVAGGLLAGCNGVRHPEDFPTDGPTVTATANPQEVSADDFGHSWALDTDHGTVSCRSGQDGDPVLRFTAPDGTAYALNEVDGNNGLPDISEIADGSVGTLRTFAFTVCEAGQ
jgi:hypothetical protein